MTAQVGDKVAVVTLGELLKGVRVHEFTSDGIVEVEYRVRRGVLLTKGDATRLRQVTNGSVVESATPWVFRDEVGAMMARGGGPGGTICGLVSATGACDGVEWGIVPHAPGYAFPGCQSDPASTGPSREVVITFSSMVSSVTVKVNDPTWPGNKIIAYDGSNVVGTADFVGTGAPGINVPSTRTITGNITRVLLVPAPNDYVTYEASVVVESGTRLNVVCSPSPVIRATTVTCTATLSNNKAFGVVLASVDGPDGSPVFIPFTSLNGGKAWQTRGPALYSTVLSVTGLSSGASYGGTGYVTVAPRSFPSVAFPSLPSVRKATVRDGLVWMDFVQPPIAMRWGTLREPKLDTVSIGSIPVVVADSGPSIGYAAVGPIAAIPLSQPEVVLNPTLYREGLFYEDQNGTDGVSDRDPNTGMLYCNNATDSTWLDRVRTFVERHEGVTGTADSHFGLWTQGFQTMNPQGSIESLVFPAKTPPEEVKGRVIGAFAGWLRQKPVSELHDPLDAAESRPSVFNAVAGCALDRDISRERD
jgi:hypothetical protein